MKQAEEQTMKCPRCGNEDPHYFYKGSRGWYCRRCIGFSRVLLEEELEPAALEPVSAAAAEYLLRYPLTPAQKEISRACAETIQTQDVLIAAVCGAGKTELVVETISRFLAEGRSVGFAIARRQVVLEVAGRLAEIFPQARVIAVCGGHTQVTDGDLIVCTTHQLYRYHQAFDCLILDEPDAFPFKGDPVLHGIAAGACRGHTIYLTATPDAVLKERVKAGSLACFQLQRRPHGHDLPVPQMIHGPAGILIAALYCWLRQHREHPRMVFAPTIRQAVRLHQLFSRVMKCSCVTSRTPDRDAVIEAFRKQPAGLIFATTVLERGVTVPGADICVYEADSGVFDEAGLIQMCGRAGRSFSAPEGSCLFLLKQASPEAERCAAALRKANLS
jgi:competence protein ComFA